MTGRTLFLSFSLLFGFTGLIQGQTTISGEAKDTTGQEITFFRQSDFITGEEIVIAKTITSPDGFFTARINIEHPGIIYMRYGVYDLYVVASPGEVHDIILPPFRDLSAADRNNPYFGHIKYHHRTNDPEDLNNITRELDSLYRRATDQIIADIFYGVAKENYDSLVTDFNRYTRRGSNDFYNRFANSRLFTLKLLSSRNNLSKRAAITFLDKEFDMLNFASVSLTDELFGGIFSKMLSGEDAQQLRNFINRSTDLDGLLKLVGEETGVSNSQLLDYIVLANLYIEYYQSSFSRAGVYRMLSLMAGQGNYQAIKDIAHRIVSRIDRLKKGNIPPAFHLKDENDNIFSADSLTGKYILLSFGESSSLQTQSEYNLLKSWDSMYQEELEIVTILTNKDYKTGIAKMRQSGYGWTMLDGSKSDQLIKLYDVRFFPTFYLLDREGRIIAAPAPFPSENLQRLLDKLLQRDLIEDIRH